MLLFVSINLNTTPITECFYLYMLSIYLHCSLKNNFQTDRHDSSTRTDLRSSTEKKNISKSEFNTIGREKKNKVERKKNKKICWKKLKLASCIYRRISSDFYFFVNENRTCRDRKQYEKWNSPTRSSRVFQFQFVFCWSAFLSSFVGDWLVSCISAVPMVKVEEQNWKLLLRFY